MFWGAPIKSHKDHSAVIFMERAWSFGCFTDSTTRGEKNLKKQDFLLHVENVRSWRRWNEGNSS